MNIYFVLNEIYLLEYIYHHSRINLNSDLTAFYSKYKSRAVDIVECAPAIIRDSLLTQLFAFETLSTQLFRPSCSSTSRATPLGLSSGTNESDSQQLTFLQIDRNDDWKTRKYFHGVNFCSQWNFSVRLALDI